jgi:hypothetical protein
MNKEPNFIVLRNPQPYGKWKAVIGPGGGQVYWREGHPLVNALFDWGVSEIFSLDLKMRYCRSPSTASKEIGQELLSLLPTSEGLHQVIFTGYSTGGMILLRTIYDHLDAFKSILHPESQIVMIGVQLRFVDPVMEKLIIDFWRVDQTLKNPSVSSFYLIFIFTFLLSL